MKTYLRSLVVSRNPICAAALTLLLLLFTSCDDDEYVNLTQGVFMTEELLDCVEPTVSYNTPEGTFKIQTLSKDDFVNVDEERHIMGWSITQDFGRLDVTSKLYVSFRKIKDAPETGDEKLPFLFTTRFGYAVNCQPAGSTVYSMDLDFSMPDVYGFVMLDKETFDQKIEWLVSSEKGSTIFISKEGNATLSQNFYDPPLTSTHSL